MPLDNLENRYKEQLAELDQTLPPEVTWSKAQGWQQLQAKLPVKRRKSAIWYQAAAVVILLIGTVLLLNSLEQDSGKTTQKVIAAEQNIKLEIKPRTPASPGIKFESQLLVANKELHPLRAKKNRTKNKQSPVEKLRNVDVKEQNSDNAEDMIRTVVTNQNAPSETTAEPLSTAPAPIKITVVLGGKTHRQIADYANNNSTKANRRRNNQIKVRVNLPGESLPEDSNLAATASQLPNRSALSARIDF